MIRVELGKLVRRPRTWVSIGLLCLLPVAHFAANTEEDEAPAPVYARAVANMKFGRYAAAEDEVIRELVQKRSRFQETILSIRTSMPGLQAAIPDATEGQRRSQSRGHTKTYVRVLVLTQAVADEDEAGMGNRFHAHLPRTFISWSSRIRSSRSWIDSHNCAFSFFR